jgi:predicted Zn-dependent protease
MPGRKIFLRRVVPLFIFLFLLGGVLRESYALMTVEEEKKLGKTIVYDLEKRVGLIKDPALQRFLDQIGYSLVAQIGPTAFEFNFYLINAPEPNAFAIPGGHIFVTTGLLILSENEQEVAGVMGHEIAHVTARHVAEMIERSKKLNIATLAAIIAGVLAGGGGKASQAAATTALAGAEALALKYTRENEVEADQTGLQYILRGGYDPQGLVTFLNKIYKTSLTMAPRVPPYLSTHPAVEDRISLLENLIQVGTKPAVPFNKTHGDFKRVQAKAFVEEREPHVAITYFESQVVSNPQGVDGYYGLGLSYRKAGRLDKSLEAFQKAHSLSPEDLDILRELGIIYFFSGKLDQAIESFEKVQALRPHGDALTLFYLGRSYQEKGDLVRALPLFMNGQKELSEFVDVYFHLGSVYGRLGQKGLSHFYFGKHFIWRGDRQSALRHFRTALDWLEKGSPERGEADREVRGLTSAKQEDQGKEKKK